MVALLLFVGLALDAGVIYSGVVNLARAVDAAALAGVVELPYEAGTTQADVKADEFLGINGVEVYGAATSRGIGLLGAYRYSITVTQQIDLYFLPLVNLDSVRIVERATAEVNPLVNLYVSQMGRYGQQATVNLSVFGPGSCAEFGDPYSPFSSPWRAETGGVYHFRLDLPMDYEGAALDLTRRWNEGLDTNDVVRIEIWDPDSYNQPGPERWDPDTPETGDSEIPFHFIRIDENRCGCPVSPPVYDQTCATLTRYSLYYFHQRGDGTFKRVPLAVYEKGGLDADADTDMLWISPLGFEIDVPQDIYRSPAGIRTLFLDVQTLSGSSENGFNLWAGPRYLDVPAEVNARNEWIVRYSGGHDSAGAAWFGVGRLPMNSNSGESDVLLTLAYFPPTWAGRAVTISAFDVDVGSPKATATIDTCVDWPPHPLELGESEWRHNRILLPDAPEYTFYGGYLQVHYEAGDPHDTSGWKVVGEANPVLVE